MPIVCGVKFRGTGKVYFFSPDGFSDIEKGDPVIVETSRGRELGHVIQPTHEVEEDKIVGELKPILRRATTLDLLDAQRNARHESEAAERCREEIARFKLAMKIVGAEFNYDGTRLTFLFTSEKRVDFRDLVRELARIFKTRIELRQIGVRDEAKLLGGIAKCGRELCCSTWLPGFSPVSIRMAKQQNLPLSPMEISGLCGRLLCCLRYENEHYREVRKRLPRVGKTIDTPLGSAKVVRVSVIRETAALLLQDGSIVELSQEQLSGDAPVESLAAMQGVRPPDLARTLSSLRQSPAEKPSSSERQSDQRSQSSRQSTPGETTAEGGAAIERTQAAAKKRTSGNATKEKAPSRRRSRRGRKRSNRSNQSRS